MEVEQELRTASDTLLHTLDQLELLENEKRTLKPDSARFQQLASEVKRLAATVFAQTQAQARLGLEGRAAAQQSGAELAPIDNALQERDLRVILSDWRTAERRLADVSADSAEHVQATDDVSRLRDEYHRAYTEHNSAEPAQD